MVKIPLSVEQINALLRWRDEHKEWVARFDMEQWDNLVCLHYGY